jgi:hypothetical protein|tara:strand:+ start:376 stop:534 length:159 start_codon:yes stop_codon:yes gene_type:complete
MLIFITKELIKEGGKFSISLARKGNGEQINSPLLYNTCQKQGLSIQETVILP